MPNKIAKELFEIKLQQADRVMRVVGALLDCWDGTPTDEKQAFEAEFGDLHALLLKLYEAAECEAALVARSALASYAGLAVEIAAPANDLKSNPFIAGTDLSESYEKGWRDALAVSRGER